MAEGVLFGIADGVKNKIVSLVLDEFALWWGFKKELGKLDGTVQTIKDVLIDAEKRARIEQTVQLKNWIGRLREAVLDAEDLLDDFSTEVQRKRLVPRSLRETLDKIKKDSEEYNFVDQKRENVPLTTRTMNYEIRLLKTDRIKGHDRNW
ncbi:unnamed protein product [Dovyalis caffra]|uniref:Disease resistance N-terminal domain-containing protein n=1 Tax=Dovyalis caffra TaxID=77055 RepID=A0AAV1SQR5_9ROSI|nr:unnamed protein product [Dovyalis caffra]